MKSAEEVLEQYRKGDFHQRLNLYLEHRDLRQSFMKNDMELPALMSPDLEKKMSKVQALLGSIRYRISRFCFLRQGA